MNEQESSLFDASSTKEFKREKLTNYIDTVTNTFVRHFSDRGYIEHNPVSLISNVDSSVLFIGATISVFKPYLLKNNIPERGYYTVQSCLRTRNIETAYNDEAFPEWTSYFTGIGTISSPKRLYEVCSDAWEFLNKKLGIERTSIGIRISSQDQDLMKYWAELKNGPFIEIDSKPIRYYRHKFGLDGIQGRNLNFAIKQKNGEYRDIGNLIVIESNPSEILGVELAFGIGTLLSRAFQLEHPLQSSLISKVYPFATGFQTKLADSLVVCIILLREGLRPTATNRGRVLRRHLQALTYLRKKSGFEIATIVQIAKDYELEEFGNSTSIADHLGYYLEEYERLLILEHSSQDVNKKLSQIF